VTEKGDWEASSLAFSFASFEAVARFGSDGGGKGFDSRLNGSPEKSSTGDLNEAESKGPYVI